MLGDALRRVVLGDRNGPEAGSRETWAGRQANSQQSYMFLESQLSWGAEKES